MVSVGDVVRQIDCHDDRFNRLLATVVEIAPTRFDTADWARLDSGTWISRRNVRRADELVLSREAG
jgi:hypothetical protein